MVEKAEGKVTTVRSYPRAKTWHAAQAGLDGGPETAQCCTGAAVLEFVREPRPPLFCLLVDPSEVALGALPPDA